MKLTDQIRVARTRHRSKKPLPPSVFTVVARIIVDYGLTSIPEGEGEETGGEGVRREPRASLFPLLTAAQWRLSQEIIARFDNPYLIYARTPEDFQSSALLFQRRPDLPPEVFREQSLFWLLTQKP